mgnify:CR=1 FL=1
MPLKNKNAAREWFNTIVYGGLIAIVFRSLLLEPFNIPSGSMIPTLHVGDHIFVEKWSYGYSRYSFPFGSWKLWNGRFFARHEPSVGDVIVFRNPTNESMDYVKRLIGTPGDKIQMRDGRLYINGEMVKRENPTYVVMNNNTYGYLKKNFLLSFGYEAGDYFSGLKVLIDNALPDYFFRIVGE